jgi:hypothetical protein
MQWGESVVVGEENSRAKLAAYGAAREDEADYADDEEEDDEYDEGDEEEDDEDWDTDLEEEFREHLKSEEGQAALEREQGVIEQKLEEAQAARKDGYLGWLLPYHSFSRVVVSDDEGEGEQEEEQEDDEGVVVLGEGDRRAHRPLPQEEKAPAAASTPLSAYCVRGKAGALMRSLVCFSKCEFPGRADASTESRVIDVGCVCPGAGAVTSSLKKLLSVFGVGRSEGKAAAARSTVRPVLGPGGVADTSLQDKAARGLRHKFKIPLPTLDLKGL